MWEVRYQRDGYSVEAAVSKGRPLPSWFLEEPYLHPGEHFYLQAFWDLGSCRALGMVLGPIPWDKAMEYGRQAGLEEDWLQVFWYFLRVMDSAYLDWQEQEADKRRKMNTTTGTRKEEKNG